MVAPFPRGVSAVQVWDDDIYKAMAHPIRRVIIESLYEKGALSFYELLKCTVLLNHGKLGFHLRTLKGFIEREPSTMKYRLTERGQLAGELIWDIRFRMKKGGPNIAHEPTRYVQRLKLGDHAILFYDTADIQHEMCFPFLKAGLLKGEAVVYVTSENKLRSEKKRNPKIRDKR